MRVLVDSSIWIESIPDLMIAQHAIQNHLELYSRDKHFSSIAQHVALSLH